MSPLQHEAAGHGLFKKAKSRQDCLAAAHEYELALRLAPWVAPLYFALGEAYEKLGDLESAAPSANSKKYPACSQPAYAAEATRFFGHERARENFEFYLLAKPGVSEQDSAGVRYRIEEIKLRFARWWQDACCDGCGGKRNSKR